VCRPERLFVAALPFRCLYHAAVATLVHFHYLARSVANCNDALFSVMLDRHVVPTKPASYRGSSAPRTGGSRPSRAGAPPPSTDASIRATQPTQEEHHQEEQNSPAVA
jgi:hypothetical protein